MAVRRMALRRFAASAGLMAAAAMMLGGCSELRQYAQLVDPPDVPTDSEAARIEAEAPFPNIFEVQRRTRPNELLTQQEVEELKADLETTRGSHVESTAARIEARER